jgi:molecular chaperone GrpE
MSEPDDIPDLDLTSSPGAGDGSLDNPVAGSIGDDAQTVARLTAELTAAKDQTLRAIAETENVRKRFRREADDQRKFAEQSLLTDLLPVMDNLRRAAEASGSDASKVAEGVRLVIQQFEGVLAKHHCEKIDAAGKPFDPNFHEALMQQPSADVPPGTVLSVFRDGYRLHDRVIRPAQVVVSKGAE